MRRLLMSLPVTAVLAIVAACGSKSAPTAPAAITVSPSPKITAPTAQTPVGGQLLGGLAATLTAASATVDISSYVLQYRFQVFNDVGTLTEDSGLVGAPTWTTTKTLTPSKPFTWQVRAESQGFAGPWSSAGGFVTPEQLPAYNRPIGEWQSCGSIANKTALVTCVWNAVRPNDSVSDLEVSKRVAWLLRGEGAGLLIKGSGENVVIWQGYALSASRICYPNGQIYKLMSDAGPGGANGPQFSDNGLVDPSLYVKAIDPSKP
ncbi:MAG TPA: hypothetical protein VF921_14055 [Vicinamibacterales bacterium]